MFSGLGLDAVLNHAVEVAVGNELLADVESADELAIDEAARAHGPRHRFKDSWSLLVWGAWVLQRSGWVADYKITRI